MGKGKKPFIDRKKAVTFHLVHRSQHDPLVTDETAPQRVLVEAPQRKQAHDGSETTSKDPTKRRQEQRTYGIFYDDDYDYLQHMRKREENVVWEYAENPNQARKARKEGGKGVKPKLNLPSSVFATEFEEEVGMLNKAAPHPGPRPDWDPDVVERLDDDFEGSGDESELSDDFVIKAMEEGEVEGEGEGGEKDEAKEGECEKKEVKEEGDNKEEGQEECDKKEEVKEEGAKKKEVKEEGAKKEDVKVEVDSDEDDWSVTEEREFFEKCRVSPRPLHTRFDHEETKSRFTEYSMTSGVIRRTEQLQLLDDVFERFYATYDDPEVGDLPMEDIEGPWHQKHPYVLDCHKEFTKPKEIEEYNKDWDRERVEKYRNVVEGDEDPDEELVEHEIEDPKQKKWDCESILSTYSNIYNHPKVIQEPQRSRKSTTSENSNLNSKMQQQSNKIEIDPKTGLPTNVLRGGNNSQLTAKALSKLENDATEEASGGAKSLCAKSVLSTLSVLSIRPKDERPEEKYERKRLIKEYRKERRVERKANAEAFKEEKKRQTHVKINKQMNQQGKAIV